VPVECVGDLCDNNVTISITSLEIAKLYAQSLSLRGGKIKAHIKLDTGMNRHGIDAKDSGKAVKEIKEILALPQFSVDGIFTHLAVADTKGEEEFTNLQIKRFKDVNDALKRDGIIIKNKHCANSAGVLKYPDAYFNMVRAGIILYGCEPDFDMENILGVEPVMSLRTRVSQIKEIKAGETIGYGRAYRAYENRKIATVSIGYADGLHRACSQKIEMLVNGESVKQVGNICMDICMLDVTHVKHVEIGDVVTVFGEDNGNVISADATARAAGTICYEIITGISPRVPKFYI
ncbi:MAG: alanine racemase, partial [Oscillospiraceae bacterium]